MREIHKKIEIGEETYRVAKMNALDGVCLFKFVAEKFLPLLNELSALSDIPEGSPVDVSGQMTKTITSMLSTISKSETKQLMIDCLNFAQKSLAGGWANVMTGRDFTIDDIEYDLMKCLQLCVQVIIWNFSDFFGEGGLNLNLGLPNTSK